MKRSKGLSKSALIMLIFVVPIPFLLVGQGTLEELLKSINTGTSGVLIGLVIGVVGFLLSSVSNLYNSLLSRSALSAADCLDVLDSIDGYRRMLKRHAILLLILYFTLVLYPGVVGVFVMLVELGLKENLHPPDWFYSYANLVIFFAIVGVIFDIVVSMFTIARAHGETVRGYLSRGKRDAPRDKQETGASEG